jgi:hypothetical protein
MLEIIALMKLRGLFKIIWKLTTEINSFVETSQPIIIIATDIRPNT